MNGKDNNDEIVDAVIMNLTKREYDILTDLSLQLDLPKDRVLVQALHHYQSARQDQTNRDHTKSHRCPSCGNTMILKEDWSGWVATLYHFDEDNSNWCVAPKEFWEANKSIPDWCLDRSPAGFVECSEHTLDSLYTLPEQEQMLRDHGFEIV